MRTFKLIAVAGFTSFIAACGPSGNDSFETEPPTGTQRNENYHSNDNNQYRAHPVQKDTSRSSNTHTLDTNSVR